MKSKTLKVCRPTTVKHSTIHDTAHRLERTLDSHGEHLVKRLELDSTCFLFDMSSTHILLLDRRRLRLIHMQTMTIETEILPLDTLDIQDIAWSSQLNAFLLLSTDRLYRKRTDQSLLTAIDQIQVNSSVARAHTHMHNEETRQYLFRFLLVAIENPTWPLMSTI
jgi:hypothetical protein